MVTKVKTTKTKKKPNKRLAAVKRTVKRATKAVGRTVGAAAKLTGRSAKKLAIRAFAEVMFGDSDRAKVKRMTRGR